MGRVLPNSLLRSVSCEKYSSALIQCSTRDLLRLPLSCPGCGAYAQIAKPEDAGFFSTKRKPVRAYIERSKSHDGNEKTPEEDDNSLRSKDADPDHSSHSFRSAEAHSSSTFLHESTRHSDPTSAAPPFCDRCHKLLHHSTGMPIAHPSIESLQEIIGETSYRDNHIYHVVDAADFPMSLIPDLQQRLSLNPQRSRNRRAKAHTFRQGRLMEISYIITRADLLAPTREQVNRLMPYITQVLRDALGHTAQGSRLGNVRLVSAHRGWWTREVKDDIWNRGGCGWLVGKANVGKSHLLQCIFPKGRTGFLEDSAAQLTFTNNILSNKRGPSIVASAREGSLMDQRSPESRTLLPPKPLETEFPTMPVVSTLPGTTAAPIRLPFGNGRGELVDLPGLDRTGFEAHATNEQGQGLIMESRPKTSRISIKPGQSLLVGDIVRITPYQSDVVFLAFPFVPTSLRVISATTSSRVKPNNKVDHIHGTTDSQNSLKSAGIHNLTWDVTKQRSGPLTRKDALGLRTEALPFIIFSADVVLEGIGWIELVAQVRRKAFEDRHALQLPTTYPQIEIASLGGRHVTLRRPMNASLMGQDRSGKSKPLGRLRRSIEMTKRSGKQRASQISK